MAAGGSRALADVGVDTAAGLALSQQIDSPLSSPVRPAVTEEDIRKEFEECGFAKMHLSRITRLVRLGLPHLRLHNKV